MAKKTASKLLIGTTVIATAAAGVVGFFTQTAKGKKMWKESIEQTTMLMKLVAQKAGKLKTLSESSYAHLVDEVMEEYQQHRELTKETSQALGDALKKEWKTLKKGLTVKPVVTSKSKNKKSS